MSAPITIDIDIKDQALRRTLADLAHKTRSLRPVMKQIGERLVRSADDNFRDESAPDGKPWRALAPKTLKSKARRGKTGLKILSDSGDLRGSIVKSADHNSVTVGSDRPYAAIHQLGGKAGRNKKTIIPARPYLGVSPEDNREIMQLLHDFLITT